MAANTRGFCADHDPGAWGGAGGQMAPDWPRVRRFVLDRAGGRCELCGRPATDVDHIVSRGDGGSDDPANLRALCGSCHARRSGAQGGRASGRARRR